MKIYIAGPDVFRLDREEFFSGIDQLCRSRGHFALIPFFSTDSFDPNEIYARCIKMIDECDAVVANLNPFRGKEPDSGTCFEVGYAVAKGKPIHAYTTIRNWASHIQCNDSFICADGYHIENFGLPLNLMLGVSVKSINIDIYTTLKNIGEST